MPTGLNGVSKSPKISNYDEGITETMGLICWMSISSRDQSKPKLENIFRDMPEILIWIMRLITSEQHYQGNENTNTSEALRAMAHLVNYLWEETKKSKITDAKIKNATKLYDDGKRTGEEVTLLKEAKS